MKTRILSFFILALAVSACQPDTDEFKASAGSADFSKYIAVGNSLTSGYADGALYHSAQLNSYPAIMATQFAKVGGGDFVQPTVTSEYGVLPGKRVLGYSTDCKGVTSLAPIAATGTPEGYAPVGYAVNNFGVPGAKSFHLFLTHYGDPAGLATGTANPYFVRFASSAGTSVIEDAMTAQATFFSLWIGNNDVLGYALSGGENGGDAITPEGTFTTSINGLVSSLTANGAKGVIANIPDITSIPFFNTVPYNGLYLTAEQAAALDGAYRQTELYIQSMGLTGFTYDIHFTEGYNAFVVEDRDSPYPLPGYLKVRQLNAGELILLTVPQDSIKCYGMGSFDLTNLRPYGIPQNYILDEEEITNITAATTTYNNIIKAAAQANNLAFVDMAEKLREAKSGLVFDGLTFTTTFVTGGLFSLDGVHMNQQGAAIVANYFIDAINKTYSANVPMAEVTSYPGIQFP